MRFLPGGPSIPDELLEARDDGNVVFFCGAGVSQPAGLPGFIELAQQLIDKLGAPEDARCRVLLDRVLQDRDFAPPLDQIFHLLRQDYGAAAIDTAVSELLIAPANANLEQHSVILRLSRSAGNRAQLVTTNFDWLFERVGESFRTHVAPALPDLRYRQPLDGLVYLHGRVEQLADPWTPGLILSSADFGRAYLADGWATRFVTDLLRNYVIVLVGYSAGDPPVRYLLEGLHARSGAESATIYAFDRGSAEAVEDRWRDRGVRALAYQDSDPQHSALWDTLRAWAERADAPDNWRRRIVDLAQQQPRTLKPYQRGQVASLIRNEVGAKLFADADPPRPAEWLCVLDVGVRRAAPQTLLGENKNFDPLDHYGLDDDPPRPPHSEATSDATRNDLLSSDRRTDGVEHRVRLATIAAQQTDLLTPRLFHLARWLGKLLNNPAFVWWVAEYSSLHPVLLSVLERQLERDHGAIHQLAYRTWQLLIERFRRSPEDTLDHPWYRLAPRLKREGWTPSLLRAFERVVCPHLISTRPRSGQPFPPTRDWDELRLRDIVSLEVRFPRLELKDVSIPAENLPDVFRSLRRGLEHASGLLADIETMLWQTVTLHPESKPGEAHVGDANKYLLLIVSLFDRLASECPEIARREVDAWPTNDAFFFDKLRIYAAMKPTVLSADAVVSWLVSLSNTRFWTSYHRRELLHTLRARWAELGPDARAKIESRIIAGPARWRDEEDAYYDARRASAAATILGWLEHNGCELTPKASELLPRLREADPRWEAAWDRAADHSYDARGGWVHTESDPSPIIDAPIANILDLAEQFSSRSISELTERDPFRGLVEQRPRRALTALSYAARRHCFPTSFWRTLLSHWPSNVSQRLRWTLAYRIVRLPNAVLSELRHYVPDWFRANLPGLAESALPRALGLWDQVFEGLVAAGGDATTSSLGDTFIRGEAQNRSRRTHGHAINSPIGKLTDLLLGILRGLTIGAGVGIPVEIRARLERALYSPGEGRDHAISELGAHLTWLHHLDPDWARRQIIPLLDPSHLDSEPAWNGYAYDNNQAGPELFMLLKPHFLDVFRHLPRWHWDDSAERRFTEQLVSYCWWHLDDARYVNYSEARRALQQTDDHGRANTVWVLMRIVKEHQAWQSFGKPFLQQAWPRERRYQTPSVSSQLALVAQAAGEDFPDAVRTLLPLLVPVEDLDMLIHEVTTEGTGQDRRQLPDKFPEPVLALFDRVVPQSMPVSTWGLGSLLKSIATAAPHLRQDPRWRRLDSIASRQ